MERRIILSKSKPEDRDTLEVLLNLDFKNEKFDIKQSDKILLFSHMDLLLLCSDILTEEEKEILRTNNSIPVIMRSDQDQNKLITDLNIYRSIREIQPKLTLMLKQAFAAKSLIDTHLSDRPDIYFTGYRDVLLNEIVRADAEEKRIISTFEALHNILKKDPMKFKKEFKKDLQDVVLEELIANVVPYLELYEKTGNTDFIERASTNFLPLLQVLKEIDTSKDIKYAENFDLIQFLVGGSTLSEQGFRYLIGINPKRKYDLSEGPHGFFVRSTLDRKGVPHDKISMLRYKTTKKVKTLKFPKIYHPIIYENISFLIQEGLIGPDLEYVLLKLRDAIYKTGGAYHKKQERTLQELNEVSETEIPNESSQIRTDKIQAELLKFTPQYGTILRRTRKALIEKYLEDLNTWQKTTTRINIGENVNRQSNDEELTKYFKNNLRKIPEAFESILESSKNNENPGKEKLEEKRRKEKHLWNVCLDYLDKETLEILPPNTVLSLDASSKNAKIHIGKSVPSPDEITDIVLGEDKKPDIEAIDKIFYHVDTGFARTHFLEDFFHIVDAYEAVDENMTPGNILRNSRDWKKHFSKTSGRSISNIPFYFHGMYRNLRRAFLIVKEFQTKNVKFAKDKRISRKTYDNFRRSYELMNQHHVNRAAVYLTELHRIYKRNITKHNLDPMLFSQHNHLVSPGNRETLEENMEESVFFINQLGNRIKEETSHQKKKNLKTLQYSLITYGLSELTKKLEDIKLPRYEEAIGGQSNE